MDLSRNSGLQRLPYELVAYVVQDLDIEDVFNLSLSSKHFQYIIQEDRFCKPVIMTKASYTLEAEEAESTGHFARALRRLTKRRGALSHACPYFVGIVCSADSYEYSGGKLCYVIEERPKKRWLRILDVHRSTDWELVIDIPTLVRVAVPQAASRRKYKFRVLHQKAGIVACHLSFTLPDAETENWLLILNPEKHQLLDQSRLNSAHRIFVRNDHRYLYVGTHSGEGADGLRKWVLRGFDLENCQWLSHPSLHLSHVVGCDVGSAVCFEIYDDWFYGLSNRTLDEVDDPDWTSYYHCFRFPLSEPSPDSMQVMKRKDSWRRQHYEGPIDDRWGFIKLEKDEGTGELVIVECRKEFLRGKSGSQRTYYTTPVVFPNDNEELQPIQRLIPTLGTLNDPPQSTIPLRVRSPHSFHTGDNSYVPSMLLRSKTYFCTYFRCCNAFLDLHDDDTSTDASGLPTLRLRAGTRRLKSTAPSESPASSICSPVANQGEVRASEEPYHKNEVFAWPPRQRSAATWPLLDEIYGLINVCGRQGPVMATGDERSVVYAVADSSKGGVNKALMLISFDPATQFHKTRSTDPIQSEKITDEDQNSSAIATNYEWWRPPAADVSMGANPKASFLYEETRSSQASCATTSLLASQSAPPTLPARDMGEGWVSVEPARHRSTERKFFVGSRPRGIAASNAAEANNVDHPDPILDELARLPNFSQ
ncbi:hypothetical protein F5Y16DRAFT_246841 [Xylariaceae sp. FL0255]|nr:hypothetical protein F5Y16DRAFT_246841 [Xylariaceae sp. FL0255]